MNSQKKTNLMFVILPIAGVVLLVGGVYILWTDILKPKDIGKRRKPINISESESEPKEALQKGDNASQALDEIPVQDSFENKEMNKTRLTPSGIRLSGRVLDKNTDNPIPAYYFRLKKWSKNNDWKNLIAETVEHEQGRFSFVLKECGRFGIQVNSSDYMQHSSKEICIIPKQGLEDLVIKLNPGVSVSGQVVDNETGLPVDKAMVIPISAVYTGFESGELRKKLVHIQEGMRQYDINAWTDAEGRFSLNGLVMNKQNFVAFHPGYAPGIAVSYPSKSRNVKIRLKRGYVIHGKVLNDMGQPQAGIEVRVKQYRRLQTEQWDSKKRRYKQTTGYKYLPIPPVITKEDGSYRTQPMLPTTFIISALPVKSDNEKTILFTAEARKSRIYDQDLEINFGPDKGNAHWCGVLLNAEKEPLADARISVILKTPRTDIHGLRTVREVVSDKTGKFRIGKLYPGLYSVSIIPKMMRTKMRLDEIYFSKSGLVDKNIVMPGGGIQGVLKDEWSMAPVGGGEYSVSAYNPLLKRRKNYLGYVSEDGSFSLHGVPAGALELKFKGPCWSTKKVYDISIKEGKLIKDQEVVFPGMSRIQLVFENFTASDWKRYSINVRRLSDNKRGSFKKEIDTEDDIRRYSSKFSAGEWRVEVKFNELGSSERIFKVDPPKPQVITINRDRYY